jgi:hypothetical protein
VVLVAVESELEEHLHTTTMMKSNNNAVRRRRRRRPRLILRRGAWRARLDSPWLGRCVCGGRGRPRGLALEKRPPGGTDSCGRPLSPWRQGRARRVKVGRYVSGWV